MFSTIGLYLSFVSEFFIQDSVIVPTVPCFTPCVMSGNDPTSTCPSPLTCTPTEYSTTGKPWHGVCITQLRHSPTYTPCIMSDPTSTCPSPFTCNPTEYSRPGQPWLGACITAPTPMTTSAHVASIIECSVSTADIIAPSSTSTRAVPAVPTSATAPIQVTYGSDSTATKTSTASTTEFTGVAPAIVAGQVGAIALIVAFLLA